MADLEFKISGKELIEVENFISNHKCSLPDATKRMQKLTGEKKIQGAIGGQYSYKFTPTFLGTAVTVKCACGQEKNVTDYDSW